jgi:hypothetical protein
MAVSPTAVAASFSSSERLAEPPPTASAAAYLSAGAAACLRARARAWPRSVREATSLQALYFICSIYGSSPVKNGGLQGNNAVLPLRPRGCRRASRLPSCAASATALPSDSRASRAEVTLRSRRAAVKPSAHRPVYSLSDLHSTDNIQGCVKNGFGATGEHADLEGLLVVRAAGRIRVAVRGQPELLIELRSAADKG